MQHNIFPKFSLLNWSKSKYLKILYLNYFNGPGALAAISVGFLLILLIIKNVKLYSKNDQYLLVN